MTSAMEVHETDKATLEQVATNPLLARGKLKKAKPKASSKGKKKDLAATVQQVKAQEIEVIEADAGAGGEEAEVLDLADQLLAQLDGQLDDPEPKTAGLTVPTQPLEKSTSGSSTGSHHSAREKLHEMKEGMKEVFNPSHASGSGSEEPKVSRQKLRKVSIRLPPSERRALTPDESQQRKEQHYQDVRKQAQEETAAENDRSVEIERDAILAGCTKLKVRIKEINPDGHW